MEDALAIPLVNHAVKGLEDGLLGPSHLRALLRDLVRVRVAERPRQVLVRLVGKRAALEHDPRGLGPEPGINDLCALQVDPGAFRGFFCGPLCRASRFFR